MALAYVGCGSNQGDRGKNIEKAVAQVEKKGLGKVLRRSPLYETDPVECDSDLLFYNCAIELLTELSPPDLLKGLKGIESDMGRAAAAPRNAPRNIDLDLLTFDYNVLTGPDLILPHPRMESRLFVLQPLNDIRPDLYHPVLRKTVKEILEGIPPGVASQKIRRC